MLKKTISIAIAALNEEKNIGLILEDILKQTLENDFKDYFELEKIVVISDGSTDKTSEIVKEFSKKSNQIILLQNKDRMGKILSLGKIFDFINSEYVICFDADVRLDEKTITLLIQPLLKQNLDLIAGNPTPIKLPNCFNVAEQAAYFSWILLQKVKDLQPNSIYSSHGRIYAISKKIYKKIEIEKPTNIADDQYVYLNSKNSFLYQKKSIVYYKNPSSIGDYLSQNIRFRSRQIVDSGLFTKKNKNEFFIKNRILILTKALLQYPYKGILWLSLYTIGYISFSLKKLFFKEHLTGNSVWREVVSTK